MAERAPEKREVTGSTPVPATASIGLARCGPGYPARGRSLGARATTVRLDHDARSRGEVDVVLFDLGGVLYDFAGVDAMRSLTGIADDDELWRRWLGCPWVRAFERGGCSAEEFAAGVVEEWNLSISPDEYLRSFRSWLRGPLEGAHELVRETRAVARVGCLSNTNRLHWEDFDRRWGLTDAFDVHFLSFELGSVKPDREIFDRVAGALAAPRERIVFLDDNSINVDGATAAGLRARRAVGVEGARAQLRALGVLD